MALDKRGDDEEVTRRRRVVCPSEMVLGISRVRAHSSPDNTFSADTFAALTLHTPYETQPYDTRRELNLLSIPLTGTFRSNHLTPPYSELPPTQAAFRRTEAQVSVLAR